MCEPERERDEPEHGAERAVNELTLDLRVGELVLRRLLDPAALAREGRPVLEVSVGPKFRPRVEALIAARVADFAVEEEPAAHRDEEHGDEQLLLFPNGSDAGFEWHERAFVGGAGERGKLLVSALRSPLRVERAARPWFPAARRKHFSRQRATLPCAVWRAEPPFRTLFSLAQECIRRAAECNGRAARATRLALTPRARGCARSPTARVRRSAAPCPALRVRARGDRPQCRRSRAPRRHCGESRGA